MTTYVTVEIKSERGPLSVMELKGLGLDIERGVASAGGSCLPTYTDSTLRIVIQGLVQSLDDF